MADPQVDRSAGQAVAPGPESCRLLLPRRGICSRDNGVDIVGRTKRVAGSIASGQTLPGGGTVPGGAQNVAGQPPVGGTVIRSIESRATRELDKGMREEENRHDETRDFGEVLRHTLNNPLAGKLRECRIPVGGIAVKARGTAAASAPRNDCDAGRAPERNGAGAQRRVGNAV
jgi:hypothetical protein